MTSATITLKDASYRVKRMDTIAKLNGPQRWVRRTPPDGDGGLYLNDGPLLAWFVLAPEEGGWIHRASGLLAGDPDSLAYQLIKKGLAS